MTIRTERVRLYDVIRTAHLERAAELAPATIVFHTRRYDFDAASSAGLPLVEASGPAAARMILRSTAREFEINEPLMRHGLRTTSLVLIALSLRRVLSGRTALVVTYCIENKDPFEHRPNGIRSKLSWHVDHALASFVARRVDRVVYGTDSARSLYEQVLPTIRRARSTTIPALPAARSSVLAKEPGSVVFLGALVERKGLPQLLRAWPQVRAVVPDAHLLVIGTGRLEAAVRAAAAEGSGIDLLVDPPRSVIFDRLDRASVLVLPSQPTSGWREQVGLPLVEGLASGCRIVTTAETGLATWLSQHGHSVVQHATDPTELAEAIATQITHGPSPEAVRAALPAEDGRLAADRWLFMEAERA